MIDIQLQRFSYFPLLFFFFFASFQGIKYILGRTEERDGRSWSERDGSVSKGRQIGKKREGGGGGGQVRGHVCKRDKTSSFHFDWQAGGGPSEPPSPSLPPRDTHPTSLHHSPPPLSHFSLGHHSLCLSPRLYHTLHHPLLPSVTCFQTHFLLSSSVFLFFFFFFQPRL